MKHDHGKVLTGFGVAATVIFLAASMNSISVSAAGTTNGQLNNNATKQEKELQTIGINLKSYNDIQEKLKAIDEYQKFISTKEIDWYAGEGSWNDPSYKLMVPNDVLTYEIVFLGEKSYPVLFLDNAGYGCHADGYQEIVVYSKGKMKALIASDTLAFYPKAGIVVSQHFGGGFGEVDKNYWLFDVDKGDVDMIAREYHLTPEANIMEYTQEDIDAMVKNGATAGEYMDVYNSPVKVDENFDWSSKNNLKELTTRNEIVKAFESYFTDYGEYETFKKQMEIFSK